MEEAPKKDQTDFSPQPPRAPQPQIGKGGIVIIVALLLVVAYLLGAQSTSNTVPQGEGVSDKFPKELLPTKNEPTRGNADIYLIEYSDLECPFCQRFHSTVQNLVDEGHVTWAYRHLPLPNHRTARFGAVISECVKNHAGGEAYWEYVDAVFDNKSEKVNELFYVTLAKRWGLTDTQLVACTDKNSPEDLAVRENEKQARGLSIRGTPGSYLVNKKTREAEFISGALDQLGVEALIDKIK